MLTVKPDPNNKPSLKQKEKRLRPGSPLSKNQIESSALSSESFNGYQHPPIGYQSPIYDSKHAIIDSRGHTIPSSRTSSLHASPPAPNKKHRSKTLPYHPGNGSMGSSAGDLYSRSPQDSFAFSDSSLFSKATEQSLKAPQTTPRESYLPANLTHISTSEVDHPSRAAAHGGAAGGGAEGGRTHRLDSANLKSLTSSLDSRSLPPSPLSPSSNNARQAQAPPPAPLAPAPLPTGYQLKGQKEAPTRPSQHNEDGRSLLRRRRALSDITGAPPLVLWLHDQRLQFAADADGGAGSKTPQSALYNDSKAIESFSSPALGKAGGPILYDPAVHAYSPSSPKSSISSSALLTHLPANGTITARGVASDVGQAAVVEKLKAELAAKDRALVEAMDELREVFEAQDHRDRVVRLEADTRSIQERLSWRQEELDRANAALFSLKSTQPPPRILSSTASDNDPLMDNGRGSGEMEAVASDALVMQMEIHITQLAREKSKLALSLTSSADELSKARSSLLTIPRSKTIIPSSSIAPTGASALPPSPPPITPHPDPATSLSPPPHHHHHHQGSHHQGSTDNARKVEELTMQLRDTEAKLHQAEEELTWIRLATPHPTLTLSAGTKPPPPLSLPPPPPPPPPPRYSLLYPPEAGGEATRPRMASANSSQGGGGGGAVLGSGSAAALLDLAGDDIDEVLEALQVQREAQDLKIKDLEAREKILQRDLADKDRHIQSLLQLQASIPSLLTPLTPLTRPSVAPQPPNPPFQHQSGINGLEKLQSLGSLLPSSPFPNAPLSNLIRLHGSSVMIDPNKAVDLSPDSNHDLDLDLPPSKGFPPSLGPYNVLMTNKEMEKELREIILAAIETGVDVLQVIRGVNGLNGGAEPFDQKYATTEKGGEGVLQSPSARGQVPLPTFNPPLRSPRSSLSPALTTQPYKGGSGGHILSPSTLNHGDLDAAALHSSLSAIALGTIDPSGAILRHSVASLTEGAGGGVSRSVSELLGQGIGGGSRRNSAASKIHPFLPIPLPSASLGHLQSHAEEDEHRGDQMSYRSSFSELLSVLNGTGGKEILIGDHATTSAAWRDVLCKERAAKHQAKMDLEQTRADLAAALTQRDMQRHLNGEHLQTALDKAAHLEAMLSENRHRLTASDLRVREMEEGHQGRMSQLLDGTLKAGAESDSVQRFRLQVSVLQGSIEVLQRQLSESRSIIQSHDKSSRENERSSTLIETNLWEVEARAIATQREAEEKVQLMMRKHLGHLMELRVSFCPNAPPAPTAAPPSPILTPSTPKLSTASPAVLKLNEKETEVKAEVNAETDHGDSSSIYPPSSLGSFSTLPLHPHRHEDYHHSQAYLTRPSPSPSPLPSPHSLSASLISLPGTLPGTLPGFTAEEQGTVIDREGGRAVRAWSHHRQTDRSASVDQDGEEEQDRKELMPFGSIHAAPYADDVDRSSMLPVEGLGCEDEAEATAREEREEGVSRGSMLLVENPLYFDGRSSYIFQ